MAVGEPLYTAVQNMAEFWNAATRPPDMNGLGYSADRTAREIAEFEQFIEVVMDRPETYRIWKALVRAHRVSGVLAHDARLVAVMRARRFDSILTFDDDLARFPEITAVHPSELINSRPPF